MRLLRIMAPLALVASLATACGSGSSSQGAGAPTSSPTSVGASSSLELRPVYARYSKGISLGPGVPQDLVATMSNVQCPIEPTLVQGMLLECDASHTVFLLKAPIVEGGVTSATAKEVPHQKLWYVQITLDPAATATLASAVKPLTGTELAYSFGGTVVTSEVIEASFDTSKLAILGTFTQAQATKLAGRISSSS